MKVMLWFRTRTLLAIALCVGPLAWADDTAAPPGIDEPGYYRVVVPFFRSHCAACHTGRRPEGDFSIAKRDLGPDFSVAAFREKWREVVDVLNSHGMPPADEPQPEPAAVAAVVDWITDQAVVAERSARTSGVVLRRLNRREYAATIRDLVGVEFDPERFPEDPPAGGFDNNGAALTMSPLLFELALDAAEEVLARALVEGERPAPVRWRFDPGPGSDGDKVRVRLDERNQPIVNGGVSPHDGPWIVIHRRSWDTGVTARDFRLPTAGLYAIRGRVAGRRPDRAAVVASVERILAARRDRQNAESPGREEPNQRQYEDDLAHFQTDRMYDYGPPRLRLVLQLGAQPSTIAEFDVEGTEAEPQEFEYRVRCTTESAGITLEYAYDIPAVLENFWMQGDASFARPEPLVDWIEIEGPLGESWPPESHRRILFDSPLREADEEGYVREVLARFMRQAWRRPVAEAEVAGVVPLFTAARRGGRSFVEAVRQPLAAVLASPHFLYLVEPAADDADPALDDHELAARLSYFLWSSQPDLPLQRLAEAGRLRDPEVRRAEADRLLGDDRATAFVEHFPGQWLGLRAVGANPPAVDLYPHYDRHLETSIVGESLAFFREFLAHDLDVGGMLQSDFVTINERLARFYGIPDVRGDAFRRVPVPAGVHRGGLVTQAAILSITSNGTRTSPVKRGTWIMKTLLGADPGLPVADAGEIAPQVPGIDKATVRRRLEVHRSLPQCARCHDRIDPLGFALENYDASGAWREQEGFGYKGRIQREDPPIDATSRMPDGTAIDGVEGLQTALAARRDAFVEVLARQLATYALGRELGLADEPAVAAIVAEADVDGHATLRGLVRAIVASDIFATR